MALLSDALHNFSDVLALVISWGARRLARKKSTYQRTFGYRRAEIFAGFINAATLIIISLFLIYGAVGRFLRPVVVDGQIVIWLAGLSIVLNGASVLLIRGEARHSMNLRSALLHLFTDMLTSVAVLAGGLAIRYLGWTWVDPLITLTIALYLIVAAWGIFAAAIRIFMEFTPRDVDIERIVAEITRFPEIRNVHHLHVWQLDDRDTLLEAHVELAEDLPVSRFDTLLTELEKVLAAQGITHINIQPEYDRDHGKEVINEG
jgi:cobalt-zinc-cadmium efflux system protein